MLPAEDLRSMHPFFVIPAAEGKVFQNCVHSLIALVNAASQNGMSANFHVFNGLSLITRARNEAVVPFLLTERLTHLFWIDADVGFSADQVFRLLLSDLDVAVAPYPVKRKAYADPALLSGLSREEKLAAQTCFPVNGTLPNGESLPLTPDADGFLEVTEAPTGFMCIKRRVLLDMVAAYPQLKYVPDGPPHPDHRFAYLLFDTMVEPETNRYLSEDYAFCRRWRDIGGKVHIDTTARLSHMGQHLYQGNFAETLRLVPFNAVGGKD